MLAPVAGAHGGALWSFTNGKISMNIPQVGHATADQVSQLFTQNKPLITAPKAVSIKSLKAVYSIDPNKSPYVIEGYEVSASSSEGSKVIQTAALIKLPPPPAPTCAITLDNKDATYRPSALVSGAVQVNGVALKARIPMSAEEAGKPAAFKEIVTVSRKQSIDSKYAVSNFQLAAPRPLPVLDGETTTEETITAEVVGLNNEVRSCSVTYKLALPPACGLAAAKYVLAPGECINLSLSPIPSSAKTKFTGDLSSVKNGTFCMDPNATDGQKYKVTVSAFSGDGSSDCVATFIADVTDNTTPPPTTPPTATPTPTPTPTTTPPGTHIEKCAYLKGSKTADLNFYILASDGSSSTTSRKFDLKNPKIFEVPVMSRSQTDSWLCPTTSRCYAMENGGRNLFIELRQADTDRCTPVPIDRLVLGCFAENTRISVSSSETRSIAELKVGDKVLNPVTGELANIERITIGPEILPMIEIVTNDRKLRVTTEHPMLTSRGLLMAELVLEGDRIVYEDGSLHKVTSMASIIGDATTVVRNFSINAASTDPNDHMVLADGIVTGDLYLQSQLKLDTEKKMLASH